MLYDRRPDLAFLTGPWHERIVRRHRGAHLPQGTLVVTTQARSTYVLFITDVGVRWVRIPVRGSLQGAKAGYQPHLPRLVPGERLLLEGLRSTPVVDVAYLPADPMAAEIGASPPASNYLQGIPH